MANQTYEVELLAEVTRARRAIDDFSKTAQKQLDGINTKTFISALNDGLDLIGRTAGRVFGELKDFLIDATKEAGNAEDAQAEFANALAISGDYSAAAAAEFDGLAKSIQSTTRFTDEQVLSSVALAKQFNITNAQAKQVTITAVDLAARTGVDLNTATRQVAQTLNGFVDRALTKAIPELKTMGEEALKAGQGIAVIQDRAKGSATFLAGTFNGTLVRLQNSFNELVESIGNFITQNSFIRDGLNLIIVALNETQAALNKNSKAIDELVSGGFLALIQTIGITIKSIDLLDLVITGLIGSLDALGRAVLGGPTALLQSITDFDLGPLKALKKNIDDSSDAIAKSRFNREKIYKPFEDQIDKLIDKLIKLQKETKKTNKSLRVGAPTPPQDSPFTGPDASANEAAFIRGHGGIPPDTQIFDETDDQRRAREKREEEIIKAQIDAGKKLNQQLSNVGVNLLKGADGAKQLLVSGAGLAADAFLPGSGAVVQQIIDLLSQGPDKVRQTIEEFRKAIPILIENIVTSIPILIEEVQKILPEVITALADRADEIIAALIKSLPRLEASIISALPRIVTALASGIVRNIPDIVEAFAKEFIKIPERFANELLKQFPGGNIVSDVGGGVGGFFSDIVSGFPFAEGGRVPLDSRFEGDRFPAKLSAGEQVLNADLTGRLERFLNSQSNDRPQTVNVVLQIGETQLASTILNLNRKGFRVA